MANIIKRPGRALPEKEITPEHVFLNRRGFVQRLAALGLLAAPFTGCSKAEAPAGGAASTNAAAGGPGKLRRNPEFNPNWKLTDEKVAATYNNFYEFSVIKERVHKLVEPFVIKPWPIEIGGLVEKPLNVDAEELIAMMPLEERVYRFRCVEAWSMVVPWTGFPLSALLEKVKPLPQAKFIKFTTFYRPNQAPGMKDMSYPWPYTEGLRLDEAMNPLTIVGTGIYGKALPKQHGAPIRMVVPWKYGYKSIKSIVKMELVQRQPATLWETLAPAEYPFESNVNPNVPHPRWSQATERVIDTGNRIKTLMYNGYGGYVARLYKA